MAPVEPIRSEGRSIPFVRWALAGLVVASGLAIAGAREGPPYYSTQESACAGRAELPAGPAAGVVPQLPPGHPPVGRHIPQGLVITGLPPGHPPIGRMVGPPGVRAEPPRPVFTELQTIDL